MRAAVALLAVVAAGVWAAPAAAAPAAAPAMPPAEGTAVITLISGDRLRISPDGRSASRLPAPGRNGVALVSQFTEGHLRVVPADAAPLLTAGRLDPRLFDVTALLDDAGTRDALPLIVTADNPAVVTAALGGPARDLATINSAAVRATTSTTATLWQRLTTGDLRTGYRKLWLDGVARPGTDVSVPLVGAPAAWAAGYTGGGVPVGVLDTGVDAGHPDLAGKVAESADFTGDGDAVDRAGHGTHVASIIAGSGAASGGRYRGVAPDVRLFSGKVCEATTCRESAVLAGMQWAARDKGLKVVNLSLGRTDEPGADLLEQAVDTLTARYGTLFVAAAGNHRSGGTAPVWSPASADSALAVGASDERDEVARFSNHGTGKPDIVAPGVGITAARSGDAKVPGGDYTTLSGTSAAAPHVAGAAAILAQQHPDWPPARLKAALTGTATPLADATRLDIANAISTPVTAEPAGLSFADPTAQRITYRNTGTSPITLALSSTSDTFAPAGSTVTVPARGAATVAVTARAGDAPRTGSLVARSGDLAVHTTLTAAPRTYRLTLRFTDRTGTATDRAYATAYGTDGRAHTGASMRLPAGTYALDAQVFEAGDGVTLLHRPGLTLDRDTTVDLDARRGRPITVTAPGHPVYAQVAVALPGGATATVQDDSFAGITAAQLGPGRTGPRTDVAATFAGPDALYSLAWPVPGGYVTGFTRTVTGPAGLSVTRAEFGGTGTGAITRLSRTGGYTSVFPLPHRRTEYFTPGPWAAQFSAGDRVMTAASVGPVDSWNTGLYGPAFPPGRTAAGPAWSTDAGHAGPPPGPVTTGNGRLSAGGTTWTGDRLSVIRFEPRSATVLGFFAQHQAPGTRLTSVTLEVSYDGGKSWQRPFASRVGDRGVLFLRPGRATVSLRVTAENSAGSTVRQTMIDAYPR